MACTGPVLTCQPRLIGAKETLLRSPLSSARACQPAGRPGLAAACWAWAAVGAINAATNRKRRIETLRVGYLGAMDEPPILLYDDDCGVCHWAVRFVLKNDSRRRFVFAALRSRTGQL